MKIEDIQDPIEQFVAFIAEREAIRIRRFVMQKPWPWTEDNILQEYRFTNVHREDDAVSVHYQKTVRNRYIGSSMVIPATVAYRWFNRPSTCDALFNEPDLTNRSVFEYFLENPNVDYLVRCIEELPTPHVTGAYLIPSKPGHSKGEGVCYYIHEWCQRNWRFLYEKWKQSPPLLAEMYEEINGQGLGSFMRGQIIADLKYLPFMLLVEDWWTWATPGPGSKKGLSIVLGREIDYRWKDVEWLECLQWLSNRVTPLLTGFGMDRLHNQDLQNCLCEFSKYTKTARGIGRPRQVFKNREPQDV